MNKDWELEDLRATLVCYVQQAQRHRFDAAEHLADAEWHEAEVKKIHRQITELEARDE